jgi:hypothetical protein
LGGRGEFGLGDGYVHVVRRLAVSGLEN